MHAADSTHDTMADKPYRFLFRMPQQLRERLVASAERHGRSLNSELLHRLERSLEAEARAPFLARVGLFLRQLRAPAAWSRGVPRVGVALGVALTAVVVAVGAGTWSSNGSADRAFDRAPPGGAQVRVPFPAIKRYTPATSRASRTAG